LQVALAVTGRALHIGADTSGEATIVTPVGVLSVATAPQLRDALLKCIADQPTAVIVDLALLHVQNAYALSVFGVVARRTSDWSGVPLILVTGQLMHGRLNLRTKTLARFVLIAPTIEAALASIRRPPMRRVTTLSLASEPAAVGCARSHVTLTCDRWACAEVTEDAVAVADELVGNAVRHGIAALTLRLELRRGLLTVAVTDDNPQPPVERRERVRPDDPPDHGLGMVIVAKLAKGWGSTTTTTGGKTVWAVLRTADPGPGAGRMWPLPSHTTTGSLYRTSSDTAGRGRFARWVDRENDIDHRS
jgi:anti-sigma regulatory factor (Ser/Thr protein kinase)